MEETAVLVNGEMKVTKRSIHGRPKPFYKPKNEFVRRKFSNQKNGKKINNSRNDRNNEPKDDDEQWGSDVYCSYGSNSASISQKSDTSEDKENYSNFQLFHDFKFAEPLPDPIKHCPSEDNLDSFASNSPIGNIDDLSKKLNHVSISETNGFSGQIFDGFSRQSKNVSGTFLWYLIDI